MELVFGARQRLSDINKRRANLHSHLRGGMWDGSLTETEAGEVGAALRAADEERAQLQKLPDRLRMRAWSHFEALDRKHDVAARRLDEFLENDDRAEIPLAMSQRLEGLRSRAQSAAEAAGKPRSEERDRLLAELEAFARATMNDREAELSERNSFRWAATKIGVGIHRDSTMDRAGLLVDSWRTRARSMFDACRSWFDSSDER